MDNFYEKRPLQATLYDPSSGAYGPTFFFLGDAPPSVFRAARRGAAAGGRGWTAADAAVLRRHYGPSWRALLSPPRLSPKQAGGAAPLVRRTSARNAEASFAGGDAAAEDAAAAAAAGAGGDFFGEGFFGADPGDGGEAGEEGDASLLEEEGSAGGPAAFYVKERAYPEDSAEDLAGKVYAASGVPPYRLHLFFDPAGGGGFGPEGRRGVSPYRLTLHGRPVATDPRGLERAFAASGGGKTVAGVPVDARLEEKKGAVEVAPAPGAQRFLEAAGPPARRLYAADLGALLAGRRPRLRAALADRYQRDLLYYGFALKYWPRLSLPAFLLAVAGPEEVGREFPLLAPPLPALRAKLAEERRLLDQAYARAKALEAGRRRLAVTAVTVAVPPAGGRRATRGRNIFDLAATSARVPAILARLPFDEEGRPAVRLAEKLHVSAAPPRAAAALADFLSHPFPGRREKGGGAGEVAFAIRHPAEAAAASAARPRFVYLTVGPRGGYAVRASWREDERVSFAGARRQLSAAAGPVLAEINAMGAAAFPLGGGLPLLEKAGGAGLRGLTVSAYWEHPLTTEGFRLMKKRWGLYEKAGLIAFPPHQPPAGEVAFTFQKGVARPPPAAAPGANSYAFLSDPAHPPPPAGCPVRIFHRTGDLRVEVAGVVGAGAFERVRRLVFALLDSLVAGPDRLPPGAFLARSFKGPAGAGAARSPHKGRETGAGAGSGGPKRRRLRQLKELDPHLYDLKKYDEGATVYSVLCQGDRQPLLFSAEEAARLGARERKKLVEFWNFTEGRPAFYRCPSARFPHLSLRAGEHPLGYCLPCCKKTRPPPGSKAEAFDAACRESHRLSPAETAAVAAGRSPAALRHVLSYGKAVPPGRFSAPPLVLAEGLFFRAAAEVLLAGVPQEHPALGRAGYFYAAAAALGLPAPAFAEELAATAAGLGKSYRGLAAGAAGAAFASAEDLARAWRDAFGPAPPPTASDRLFEGGGPFAPGGGAAAAWPALCAGLVRLRFGVELLTFADPSGRGELELAAEAGAARAVAARQADAAFLVEGPEGVYPLVARPAGAAGGETAVFPPSSPLHAAARGLLAAAEPPAGPAAALAALAAACRGKGHRCAARLINLRGLCYALLVAPSWAAAGALAYLPVAPAPDVLNDPTPPLHGPRPPGAYPAAALARLLAELDGARAARFGRGRATARACLRDPAGAAVGFIEEGSGFFYHHDPAGPSPEGEQPPWGGAPAAAVPHPTLAVDRAIFAAAGRPAPPALPEDKEILAEAARRRLRLYGLFTAEFAAFLAGERDRPLRRKLAALFEGFRFAEGPAAFGRALAALLPGRPQDADAVRALAARALESGGGLPKRRARLLAAFDEAVFAFDRVTLWRLRALPGGAAAVEAELRGLMRPRVELALDGAAPPLPNIHVACALPSSAPRPQCAPARRGGKNRRLLLPEDRFAPFLSLLAADVLNPLKTFSLASAGSGVEDAASFIARPGETVRLR